MTPQQELAKLDAYLAACKPHEKPILQAKRKELQARVGFNEDNFDFGKWVDEVISKGK